MFSRVTTLGACALVDLLSVSNTIKEGGEGVVLQHLYAVFMTTSLVLEEEVVVVRFHAFLWEVHVA